MSQCHTHRRQSQASKAPTQFHPRGRATANDGRLCAETTLVQTPPEAAPCRRGGPRRPRRRMSRAAGKVVSMVATGMSARGRVARIFLEARACPVRAMTVMNTTFEVRDSASQVKRRRMFRRYLMVLAGRLCFVFWPLKEVGENCKSKTRTHIESGIVKESA